MGFLIKSVLFIFLSIAFYQIVLYLPIVEAQQDVLNPGDKVFSNDFTSNLVSANGKFTLGFFSNLTYFGIWYTDDPLNKLWVGNRDIPIMGVGILMIDESGTLKVVNINGTTLYNVFYNQVGYRNNTRAAVLDDTGNFLVYDATENRTLWQSFDHPTDTIVTGMKIGYNLTTKQNWTLTSWLTDEIPASGAFTMRLEQYQNSPQLLIYWRGELYWASGPWETKNKTFEKIPLFQYKLSLVSDASGMVFNFQSSSAYASSSKLQLTSGGRFIAGGNLSYLTPSFCNIGFNQPIYYLDECSFSADLPKCRRQDDSFQLQSGNWINTLGNDNHNSSLTFLDCMELCKKDCKCAGFMTKSNGTGCMSWSYDTPFQFDQTGQMQPKYVMVSIKPPKNKTWIWILVPVATVLTIVFTALMCYMRIRRHKLKEEEKRLRDDYIKQLTGSDSFNVVDELERGIAGAPDVKIFSLGAIIAATDNFSDANKLGQGGYGPVYKGKLSDGREIAIKRLSKTSGQGIEQFKSELILISKLQHTNLVRLYGCCIHHEEKMLIYEFMPNKSLDFFLFVEDEKKNIDWRMRLNIIEGVAQGLLYLHKYSRMRVIHRDLKVSNVLLDKNMNPKIADFGLAKIFQPDVTEGTTYRVVGTYGYMAPEYAMQGTFSIKSDVFSFGVLVLEIVSGKKNSSYYNLDRPLNLVGYAWELWKSSSALELKDDSLGESYDLKQLLRTVNIGLLCVQENADDRPTMSEVISMLNNEIIDLPDPKQPAYFTQFVEFRPEQSSEHLLDNNIQLSKNGLTITTMVGR